MVVLDLGMKLRVCSRIDAEEAEAKSRDDVEVLPCSLELPIGIKMSAYDIVRRNNDVPSFQWSDFAKDVRESVAGRKRNLIFRHWMKHLGES